ncbi:MAG TPA: hypothetical protein VFA46_16865 [Actinomycetes bacterium]|jgi:hypothetical protein|nr:hypothetical protein [Actinomycetes bacterium]
MAFTGQVLDFHQFANAGDQPAVVRVQVEPALRMEQLYEIALALASEGRTLRSGMPKPLELALFMREFEQEVRAPVAPGLVRAVMTPLAWLGAHRGLDQRHQALSGLAAGRPTPRIPALAGSPALVPAPRAHRPLALGTRGRPAAGARPAGGVESASHRLT